MRNANSASPSTEERRWRRTNLSLERVERRPRVASLAAERARPEHLPDHRRVLQESFSVGERPSSRAAMMPWRVSGSGSSSVEPRSSTARRTARRRAGFRRRVRGASLGLGRETGRSSSARPGAGRLARPTAARARAWARWLPAAPARAALEQLRPGGRDDEQRHSVTQSTRSSTKSSRPHRPSGDPRRRARAGAARRAPRGSGARRRSLVRRSPPAPPRRPSPTSGRRCDSTHVRRPAPARASATAARSFAATSAGVSCSRMPACAFTISPSAQSSRPRRRQAATLPPGDQLRVRVDDPARARRRAGSCRCPGRRRA